MVRRKDDPIYIFGPNGRERRGSLPSGLCRALGPWVRASFFGRLGSSLCFVLRSLGSGSRLGAGPLRPSVLGSGSRL